jgi:hypothetical protein
VPAFQLPPVQRAAVRYFVTPRALVEVAVGGELEAPGAPAVLTAELGLVGHIWYYKGYSSCIARCYSQKHYSQNTKARTLKPEHRTLQTHKGRRKKEERTPFKEKGFKQEKVFTRTTQPNNLVLLVDVIANQHADVVQGED